MSLEDLVSKQTKIMTYIKQDKSTARELIKAEGDISKIKNVIKRASTDNFIIGITDAPHYATFIMDVADQIIAQHQDVIQEQQDIKLGLRKKPVKTKKKKYVKKHKSKTSTGKVYSKGYSKWSAPETTFLKSRKDKPANQVVKEYNEFFGDSPRSKSSIITKIYRVRR